ncbi:hypothetical protein PITC_042550 [Penicillium italicum]|uniref:Uncharacterized protein n=1 Tax=Penicillium italicum TaxID=40296 RepID=A0A0A2KPN2_PENIT|nr:hypothetical protein PITC_042550 [Penicillium italicum]
MIANQPSSFIPLFDQIHDPTFNARVKNGNAKNGIPLPLQTIYTTLAKAKMGESQIH